MTMLTNTKGIGGLLPEDYAQLIVQPVTRDSAAAQASTVVTTASHELHFPVITDDPTAAWTAEGAEIDPSDATPDEIVATPTKVAGLTVITRELANDSSPAATQIVGDGLARSIVNRVDGAFFGKQGANPNQPKGLEDLAGVGTVTAPTAWANLDPFAEAISRAETVGATVNTWVANPADALALAKLKDEANSNRPLLGTDPTQPTRRLILGIPLLVSPAVTTGTVWGIPKSRAYVVIREGAVLEIDKSVYFTSDRVAARAIMRVTFAFPHAAAIQKIKLSA